MSSYHKCTIGNECKYNFNSVILGDFKNNQQIDFFLNEPVPKSVYNLLQLQNIIQGLHLLHLENTWRTVFLSILM